MAKKASLSKSAYSKPKVWTKGFVSQRQVKHFRKTSNLNKYYNALIAYIPKRGSARQKINSLPYRVKRSRR